MNLVAVAVGLVAALAYAAAGAAAARVLSGNHKPGRFVLPLAVTAVIVHFLYLALVLPEGAGTDFSLMNIGASAGFLITCVVTLIHWRRPILPVLPAAYFIAAVVIVVASLVPERHFYDLGHKPQMVLHIALSLTAYALFNVCALLALLVAFIQHRLKQKTTLAMNPAIPSLVAVEQLLQQILTLGIVVLAAAVATGFLFLHGFWGQGQAHKAILTTLALVVYCILWWRQRQVGVRGRTLVLAHLGGATLLTIAYFGSRLIREILLGRA